MGHRSDRARGDHRGCHRPCRPRPPSSVPTGSTRHPREVTCRPSAGPVHPSRPDVPVRVASRMNSARRHSCPRAVAPDSRRSPSACSVAAGRPRTYAVARVDAPTRPSALVCGASRRGLECAHTQRRHERPTQPCSQTPSPDGTFRPSMVDGRWVCALCGRDVRYRLIESNSIGAGSTRRPERLPHYCSNLDCPNHTPPAFRGWATRAGTGR